MTVYLTYIISIELLSLRSNYTLYVIWNVSYCRTVPGFFTVSLVDPLYLSSRASHGQSIELVVLSIVDSGSVFDSGTVRQS